MDREGLSSGLASTEVSRPHGRPRRVMITSSPRSIPRSISLKWAFASLMLYVAM